jgi:hypothetical protein
MHIAVHANAPISRSSPSTSGRVITAELSSKGAAVDFPAPSSIFQGKLVELFDYANWNVT